MGIGYSPTLICWTLAVALFFGDSLVLAQDAGERGKDVVLPGEARQLTGRLAGVANLVRRERWTEALEEYQKLIEEAGDNIVPLDADAIHATRRSIQVRQLCHQQIAALPPAALRLYRDRVDVQAERWLREAKKTRDERLLRRIVDESFCSRVGDQALDLLGDIAFEQGNFEEAQCWWRRLTPPPSANTVARRGSLRFPDPTVDLARVMAKDIIAGLFQGAAESATAELAALRKLQSGASGWLAGRKGNYADIVQEVIEQWRAGPPLPESLDWPTFAGAASRNRALAAAPPRRLWADGPAWRVRIDTGELLRTHVGPAEDLPRSPSPRRLAFHPIIAEDHVFVAGAHQVLCFQLRTGQLVFRYELKGKIQPAAAEIAPPTRSAERQARYTLTVADGLAYARLGAQTAGTLKEAAKSEAGGSWLVCLSLHADPAVPADRPGRERWRIPAPGAPGEAWAFEGAPIVHAAGVYVALTHREGNRTKTAIACFDAASGTARWRVDVCDTPVDEDASNPHCHLHLLTLAGSQVVYATHTGAIVAVDARTGRRNWALRYPVHGFGTPGSEPSPRELAPCLYANSRLFAAPADYDGILCMDALTGRVLWERDHVDVVHLLAAAGGRLIFTTPAGLRALNAATGEDQGGWAQPDEGKLHGLGRGLVAGGWLFWPTQDSSLPFRAVRLEDGAQQRGEEAMEPTDLRGLYPGNLALGGGCLVIAGEEDLIGYVPPEVFLKQRQLDAAGPSAPATAIYRLALSEAGAGRFQEAFENLARADGASDAGRTLKALIGAARPAFLADLEARKPARLASLLGRLVDNRVPLEWGLPTLTTLASVWRQAGAPDKALEVWQAILGDRALRRQLVAGPGIVPQRAGDLAEARIREVSQDLGAVLRQPPAARSQRVEAYASGALHRPLQLEMTLPLVRAWTAAAGTLLMPAKSSRSPRGEEQIFFVRGTEVNCRDAGAGLVRWTQPLLFEPAWLGFHGDLVVIGGRDCIQALRRGDGGPAWELTTTPASLQEDEQALSGFQLSGERLFFFQGRRRLYAVDANVGRITWSFQAPGAAMRPLTDGGRFHTCYYAGETIVIVQSSGGSRFLLAAGSGQVLHRAPTVLSPWPQAPVPVSRSRLVLLEDARHVTLLDAEAGKTVWTYKPRLPTSLTGESPRLFTKGDVLCLVVPVSFGYLVERLDPATGAHLWPPAPARISSKMVDALVIADDRGALYYTADHKLYARSLANGKRLWTRPLSGPECTWQVLLLGQALAVYPVARWETVGQQAASRFCTVPLVFTKVRIPLPDPLARIEADPTTFHVSFHDPGNGEKLERLSLNAGAAWADVQLLGRRLVIAADGRAHVYRDAGD
jgi:outer membrane protein assembly factor BamB